jgi:hypothetical protein
LREVPEIKPAASNEASGNPSCLLSGRALRERFEHCTQSTLIAEDSGNPTAVDHRGHAIGHDVR